MINNEHAFKIITKNDLNHNFVKREDQVLLQKLIKDVKFIYFMPLVSLLLLNVILLLCLSVNMILHERLYIDLILFALNLICFFLLNRVYSDYKSVYPVKLFNSQYGKVYSKRRPSVKERRSRLFLSLLKFPKIVEVEFDSYFDKSLGKMALDKALLNNVLVYKHRLQEGDKVLVVYMSDLKCYAIKVNS